MYAREPSLELYYNEWRFSPWIFRHDRCCCFGGSTASLIKEVCAGNLSVIYYTNKANLCASVNDTEHLNQNLANSHDVEIKIFLKLNSTLRRWRKDFFFNFVCTVHYIPLCRRTNNLHKFLQTVFIFPIFCLLYMFRANHSSIIRSTVY